jgi:predicted amidophosphoribosyltransferase
VHVVAMYRPPLAGLIRALKYNGPSSRGWALIFGRLVVGYLEANMQMMRPYEIIVPNPTFADPDPNRCQHTELTLDAARRADFGWWPIDQAPWALTKSNATPSGANQPWSIKNERAALHAAAITVDVDDVGGKRVLVYDDLFTTGLQLHHVGRRLLEHGATSVDGLVLARAPWRPAP